MLAYAGVCLLETLTRLLATSQRKYTKRDILYFYIFDRQRAEFKCKCKKKIARLITPSESLFFYWYKT
jgi:hypothetical protein